MAFIPLKTALNNFSHEEPDRFQFLLGGLFVSSIFGMMVPNEYFILHKLYVYIYDHICICFRVVFSHQVVIQITGFFYEQSSIVALDPMYPLRWQWWKHLDSHTWLVVWNIFVFPYIGNFIIPTDFHSIIFQRGRWLNHQPAWIMPWFSVWFCMFWDVKEYVSIC